MPTVRISWKAVNDPVSADILSHNKPALLGFSTTDLLSGNRKKWIIKNFAKGTFWIHVFICYLVCLFFFHAQSRLKHNRTCMYVDQLRNDTKQVSLPSFHWAESSLPFPVWMIRSIHPSPQSASHHQMLIRDWVMEAAVSAGSQDFRQIPDTWLHLEIM